MAAVASKELSPRRDWSRAPTEVLVVKLETLNYAVKEALILERKSLGFLASICLEPTSKADVTAGSARATTGTLVVRELSSSSDGSALTLIFLSLHR